MAVDVSLHGHVALLTLNEPQRRNCISGKLVGDLHAALDSREVAGARAIVITGAGSAFCAGADIHDLLTLGWLNGQDRTTSPVGVFRRLKESAQVTIAAVNGMALGGGVELMLGADLAVASVDATFTLPEIAHGVIPNTGLALLPAIVGRRRALEWVLTRRAVTANEALACGLVSQVVATAEVVPTALALAERIVANASPGAIAQAKHSLNRHAQVDWGETEASLMRLPNEEWQEGLGAFTERRKPDYARFWPVDPDRTRINPA